MDREVFRADDLPVLQNQTFASADEARNSPTGNVVLVQDEATGVVCNSAFDSSRLTYDRNYQNEQAWSPTFRRHLDEVKAIISRHFTGQSLLEIGCGKGYFLEYLRAANFEVLGVDPAYDGDSQNVIRAPFEPSLGISADGIILRHVLEHIPDPLTFLATVAASNGGRGHIYIEVPCFDWILSRRAWFDIFYEHVNYFRLADFERMFGRIAECGRIFGGQYLYVVADLASLRSPARNGSSHLVIPEDFLAGISRAATLLGSGRRNAIWGAASKGVILAIYLKRAGIDIDIAIDINPAKQGRYLPVSGLEVASPDTANARLTGRDNMLVMNSNYLDEIIAESHNRYTYITVDHAAFL